MTVHYEYHCDRVLFLDWMDFFVPKSVDLMGFLDK